MTTKTFSAIVYGWKKLGRLILDTTIYQSINDNYVHDNLTTKVIVYSIGNNLNTEADILNYAPDIVLHVDSNLPENELANLVATKSVESICVNKEPIFSIFTPTYNTGIRLFDTYESIKNQRFQDWEWVIVDDSTDEETWKIIEQISRTDSRVRINRILPISGGNIGLVKNRTCSLCNGKWLVELDHDDYLMNNCLFEIRNAIEKYPDTGFLYSDFCVVDDEQMVNFTDIGEDWYANSNNLYAFGYAGNTWLEYEGKKYLRHHHNEINPLTIRYNISMPHHVRVWKKSLYQEIGGHNKGLTVADDFEIILRTFLKTKMTHIKKMLYIQKTNRKNTTSNNWKDINIKSRLIRDYFDKMIHDRIIELGFHDWCWNDTIQSSHVSIKEVVRYYYEKENIMNYIYE